MSDPLPSFATYLAARARFGVAGGQVRQALADLQAPAIAALSVYGLQHLWRGELPAYAVITTPETNGGWGHLMPVWFKPHERPIPIHALDSWALFATAYAHSFGPSGEARALADERFTAEHLLRATLGTNLLLPFLPSTQGRGLFLRHGMLPFLLGILWLPEPVRDGWLRLHELGAARFLAARGELLRGDIAANLAELEFSIFAAMEQAGVTSDAAVAELLAGGSELSLLYAELFGAICVGVTALARRYRREGLDQWRAWAPQEIGVGYRLDDYALADLRSLASVGG
ncbi:hypothetical protein K2Z83_25005 [Oscillochloris sp. ZM17-4]|uniref:hypothetical protein n=1 Tax=Oscillochloris sp. ZM17-4 TaxID=2866714 RepID=UPI001C733C0C|nr:hypothetical protein [Oscillochloris sp. ZM17-4]MBX0330921.1 hypothetical protein [Oscillochloris sp. ZM17-4]